MAIRLAVVSGLLLLAIGARPAAVRVDPASQQFVTPDGRVLILHGVNAVYKRPPFVPSTSGFDPLHSLGAEDIAFLKAGGFNAVRYGLLWSALMPSPGVINETFLAQTTKVIRSLEEAGIYVLIDAHQDDFGRKFCGEGFPEFAARTNASSATAFPWPLPYDIPRDPQTGLPELPACQKHPFFEYLLSLEVNQAWGALYNESTGLQAYFAQHWARVARQFANSSEYILGYELVNEPYAGDALADPLLLLEPGRADRVNLMPLYRRLYGAIRSADPSRVVMYESMLLESYIGEKAGFDAGPGGAGDNDKQALSVHLYCLTGGPDGNVANLSICNDTMALAWQAGLASIEAVGGGRALTEFGAVGNTADDAGMISLVMKRADAASMSAFYWPYKPFDDITTSGSQAEGLFFPNGTVQDRKLAALSRPYPQKTPCEPSSLSFGTAEDGTFSMSYTLSSASTNRTGVVFVPVGAFGGSRPDVALLPPSAASVRWQGPLLLLEHADAGGVHVSLRLTAAS